MAPANETVIRAVGMALASLSAAFAMYMLAYGAGEDAHQRHGASGDLRPAARAGRRRSKALRRREGNAATAVDMAATGSVANSTAQAVVGARPIEIVAAQADRVWLKIDGGIHMATPGDERRRAWGRIGAIVARKGGWVLLDDKGGELLGVAKGANGASLFTRGRNLRIIRQGSECERGCRCRGWAGSGLFAPDFCTAQRLDGVSCFSRYPELDADRSRILWKACTRWSPRSLEPSSNQHATAWPSAAMPIWAASMAT